MKKYFSRPKFWGRLLSFLLCVVMLVCTVAAMLVADIRIATNKENTATIIKQALFATHTVRLPGVPGNGQGAAVIHNQNRLSMVKLEESSEEASNAMVEMIYGMIMEQSGGQLDVSLEEVQEFVDESTFGDFVADMSASLISDLITGENTTVIDEETISALLEENAPLLEEYFDVVLDEEIIAQVTDTVVNSEYVVQIQEQGVSGFLSNNKELAAALGLSAEYFDDPSDSNSPNSSGNSGMDAVTNLNPNSTIADYLAAARAVTSTGALICCIAAVVVLIALLCLVNRKHIWYAIRGTGRTFIIAALPMSIPTLVYLTNITSWNETFSMIPEIGTMIGKVAGLILQMTAPVNLSVLIAGLVLAILGTVLKFVAKSKAKRKAAAEEAAAAEENAYAEEDILVAEEIPVEAESAEIEVSAEEAPAEEAVPAAEEEVLAPEEVPSEEIPAEEIKEEVPVE